MDGQTRVVTGGEDLELATYAHTRTHAHTHIHTPPITHPCRVLPTAPPKWPQRLIPPVPLGPLQKQNRKNGERGNHQESTHLIAYHGSLNPLHLTDHHGTTSFQLDPCGPLAFTPMFEYSLRTLLCPPVTRAAEPHICK